MYIDPRFLDVVRQVRENWASSNLEVDGRADHEFMKLAEGIVTAELFNK